MRGKRIMKLAVDVILGLLFLVLLGYSFTGGQLHEVLGILFAAVVVIHNILNKKWYSVIRKGSYSKKRKMVAFVNIALLIDAAVLILTGILNSRCLFNIGLSIPAVGQIHTVLALAGFVLIVYHILLHAFTNSQKEHKKLPVVLAVLTPILAVVLGLWILPYFKRQFDTVKINHSEVISGEQVDFGSRKVLTVYFTRIGNTDFEEDVDAVAGASLLLDEKEELLGSCQIVAQMIKDAAGGKLIPINVKNKYPSAYSDTVSVAGEEKSSGELPQLIDMPGNIDEYDTVFLVYPLWWWTIPKPVEAFLDSYDFSGKTLIPVVTHGGSGAGESLEDIKSLCNAEVIEQPLEIYCSDIPYCRDDITEWLEEIRSRN